LGCSTPPKKNHRGYSHTLKNFDNGF